jgi:hypothetical protein
MTAPTMTATIDDNTVAPGQPMTLTVNMTDADDHTATSTIVGEDQDTHETVTVTVTRTVTARLGIKSITDTDGITWQLQSRTGNTLVYTATQPS